ncbi:hypothetical protein VitviT2T_012764 [Vitis vinifera]|uniref:Uncharacterized protein n=2 Tax=Vitis vinifera TaxID=29760 RepID=A0ABY9CI56_VITVI|nr:hypothetical protein CK203_078267 [Vitis vinifera]WJZ93860.1 hypothetical protein VitviT2T_012764 [Vitis vinifera]
MLPYSRSTIDHPEPRRTSILWSFLGTDEEVAQILNEITHDLVPNHDAYKDIKQKIQKQYGNIVSTWMTQGFLHNHFSSPWTFLAFLGAVFAFFFSGIQEHYFTIFPPFKTP